MSCHISKDGRVALCTPSYNRVWLSKQRCFDRRCKGEQWHVVAHEPYYGLTRCCLKCGRDSSNDGEGWMHRPPPPGLLANEVRQKNIDFWRKIYRRVKMGAMMDEMYMESLRKDVKSIIESALIDVQIAIKECPSEVDEFTDNSDELAVVRAERFLQNAFEACDK